MDKDEAANVLGDLKPSTEYADFLKMWPHVQEAMARQNNRKEIWNALKESKLLTVSYVTFTRFVNKALDEKPNLSQSKKPAAKTAGSVEIEKSAVGNQPSDSPVELSENESHLSESAVALKQALKQSTGTNYSRVARELKNK